MEETPESPEGEGGGSGGVGKAMALNVAVETGKCFCGLVVFGFFAVVFVPW